MGFGSMARGGGGGEMTHITHTQTYTYTLHKRITVATAKGMWRGAKLTGENAK
jgi:hypothetical protein